MTPPPLETNLEPETKEKLEEYFKTEPEKITVKLILEKPCYLCGTPIKWIQAKGILTIAGIRYPICKKCINVLEIFRVKK